MAVRAPSSAVCRALNFVASPTLWRARATEFVQAEFFRTRALESPAAKEFHDDGYPGGVTFGGVILRGSLKTTNSEGGKPMPRGRRRNEYSEPMVRDVIRWFLKGLSTSNTAAGLNAEWKTRGEDYDIKTHQVLKIVHANANKLQVVLRADEEIAKQVAERFGFQPEMIDVNMSSQDLDAVARRTAVILFEKIRAWRADRVRVGFGAGRSTKLVARHLGAMLTTVDGLPQIVIHCLTGGLHIDKAELDPISFGTYFEDVEPRVKFVSLPRAPLAGEMTEREREALGNPFAIKWDIDVIVSALANYQDPNSEHRRLLHALGLAGEAERKGIRGDFLYCSFGEDGKIDFDTEWRVGIFGFDELREFASTPGKEVILVSGPCGGPERTRHEALRLLLEKGSMQVWSRIVTDRETARNLLVD